MIVTTPESVDQFGRFTAVTREIDANGKTLSVHRAPIVPGRWRDGEFEITETSGFNPVIKAFAAELWTAEIVDVYKAAFPDGADMLS